ncbi:MAG: xanthine dehydrogenase family protein subunit M [Tepidisphaeraceae bacterium]
MRPFEFQTPDSVQSVLVANDTPPEAVAAPKDGSMFHAGGTNLVDLMKIGVVRPSKLVSVNTALPSDVREENGALIVGAGCRMSGLADHDAVRTRFPVVRQALVLAASPQIRNMASVGGNLLQRTRCPYFRDISYPCNKREPGTGCPAIKGDHRNLAILGTSDACIATHPGDFAIALVALDASLDLKGPSGDRSVKLREFYKLPGNTPHVENDLKPGELIVGIRIPGSAAATRSFYHKVRDRASYAFALTSAAVGLEFDGQTIKDARVALGGVGAIPWHAKEAEQALIGKPATLDTFSAAADAALRDATPLPENKFKVPLAKATLVRALQRLAEHGPVSDQELWHMQHGR